MTITLPLPPSVNHYWRHVVVRGRVRVLVSAEGREYKRTAGLLAIGQGVRKLHGPVSVSGTVYMARRGCDLDNRLKVAFDVLKGIAWTDDRQVARLAFTRELDPRNPRVVLTIEPIDMEAAA